MECRILLQIDKQRARYICTLQRLQFVWFKAFVALIEFFDVLSFPSRSSTIRPWPRHV